MQVDEGIITKNNTWEPVYSAFLEWLGNRHSILEPGLSPEPTIKVLSFLALFDANKPCTYDELREIFSQRKVIAGNIPDNTLRTSVLSLGKTLDKFKHSLELKSFRGRFQLISRQTQKIDFLPKVQKDPVVLLLEPVIKAPEIASILIEKAMLPFNALYFLESSARSWQIYSSKEAEIHVAYEAGAWARLEIKDRLCNSQTGLPIGVIGLAAGEGLGEIGLLKEILSDETQTVHYLAVDSSPRLLRDHIGLLKETLAAEIECGRLVCVGVVADIFTGLREAIGKVRIELRDRGIFNSESDFLPSPCGILVTYFGNCLGNNYQDLETEIFSILHSIFQNRSLEVLVGVSVMQATPDDYKRSWEDFFLQAPRHLLETKKLLKSSRDPNSKELPEFVLPHEEGENDRCPVVKPEPYIVRHQVEGQIYRFYYRLAFDLELAKEDNIPDETPRTLPKGTLILLYNIVKYNMRTLVDGIEKGGLFKVKYDPSYRQVLDIANGKREYAVFSAYLER